MTFLIDHAAREVALTRWALPESLHVPIAALDEAASYIGEIEQVLADGSPRKALLIRTKEPPPIDMQFPIWELPTSSILYERLQVWVHIKFTRYRRAYRTAFPDEAIDGKVLSHALNRRMAVPMGFSYVRITLNSRGCNSSSSFSEQWGVALHATPEQVAANRRRGVFIQYADLAALMVMLDMKPENWCDRVFVEFPSLRRASVPSLSGPPAGQLVTNVGLRKRGESVILECGCQVSYELLATCYH